MASEQTAGQLRARIGLEVVATLRRSADRGFLGGMPVEDQIDHALGFVAVVEGVLGRPPATALDLGTGGGVPGVVLHACWPGSRVVLTDGSQKRTEFLVRELEGWGQPDAAEVVRGRAEELGRLERFRRRFEVVTARSFGAPAVTAECGAPLLADGGLLVVSEPPGEQSERWPAAGLEPVGLAPLSTSRFDDRFGYRILVKTGQTPERYPRRVGIPAKRPLF